MSSNILAMIGAGLVGICVALEPTINSGLGRYITPKLAALHSFVIGSVLLLIISLFSGGFKEYRLITKAPLYLWIGGFIGVVVVYIGARVATVIGIASTLTIMVAVQLITGMLIDNYGLFGVEKVPFDIARIIGIVLLIAAVKLIVK